MAAPTITKVGSNAVTAANASIATGATVTAATANNDWLVVVVAAAPRSDNPTPIASCSDTAGNVYTLRAEVSFGSGAAGDGAALTFFTAPVTVNITSGTVTATGPDPCNERCIQVFRVTPSSGTISFITADNTGVGGNLTNHAATTVSVTNGNTIFGAAALETDDSVTGDSDTSNGSWSTVDTDVASGISDAESLSVVTQYKTVTGTGNQSWACSTTSARQSVCSYLVIKADTSTSAVTLLASDGLSSASPTITSAATITAVVGDWLLVAIAANNRAADGSSHWADIISDSDGINTYVTRVNVNYNPGGTNTGATVILVTAAVTDTLTNATISMTWDTAAFGAGAYQIFRIRPGAGETIAFVAADTTGSTGSATLHSAATVSVALGNMIFGAAAIETNVAITGDSDTTNGSWSALSTDFYPNATDTLGMTTAVQWKTVTGTGNQSWSCSTTSAKDSARTYLVLHLASAAFSLAAAQGQYTLSGQVMTPKLGHVPIVAGVGSYALTGTATTLTYSGTTKTIVAGAGSYTLLGTDAALNYGYRPAAAAGSYVLTGSDVLLTKASGTAKILAVESGVYSLTGSDATPLHIGANVVAGVGAYALTGTDATLKRSYRIAAGDESVVAAADLLLETGDYLLFETGDRLLLEDSGSTIVGGVYSLTGSAVIINATTGNKTASVDSGSYVLTGTDGLTLHGWRITAGGTQVELLDELGNPILDELGNPIYVEEEGGGAYALTGTDATLTLHTVSHLTITVEPGSYLLTGTEATLRSSAVPLSPLHIGEWPIDKRKRRAREDARAKEQRARERFRRAIARLLEGLPPEFDEPADLDEALDNAVQASNLLYALSAPIQEINAVNELIDHIKQLRIAQPIAQAHLAQAYNQAHRHLTAKAQEDTVMALLLGE